jgi:hypothetical protein
MEKKYKLIKQDKGYYILMSNGFIIGTSDNEINRLLMYPHKLSKSNCDEVFSGVDTDKFSLEEISLCMKKSYGIKYFSETKMLENLKALRQQAEMEVGVVIGETQDHQMISADNSKLYPKLDADGCLILRRK